MPAAAPRERGRDEQQRYAGPVLFFDPTPAKRHDKDDDDKKNPEAVENVVFKRRQRLPFGDIRPFVKQRRNQVGPKFQAVDIDQCHCAAKNRGEQKTFELFPREERKGRVNPDGTESRDETAVDVRPDQKHRRHDEQRPFFLGADFFEAEERDGKKTICERMAADHRDVAEQFAPRDGNREQEQGFPSAIVFAANGQRRQHRAEREDDFQRHQAARPEKFQHAKKNRPRAPFVFDVMRQHRRERKRVVVGNRAETPDVRADGEFAPKVAVADVVRGEDDGKRKDAEEDRQPSQGGFRCGCRIHGKIFIRSPALREAVRQPRLFPPLIPSGARAQAASFSPGTCSRHRRFLR